MKTIDRAVLFFVLIAVIALTAYSFILARHFKDNETIINELKSKLNKNELIVKSHTDKLNKYIQLVNRLDEDYISRKKFDEDPLYLDYKKNIASSIDEKISEIVTEKPLHGGKWAVSKIEFMSPSFAYVDYEDGHHSYSILMQIVKSEKGYSFKVMN